MAEFKFPTSQAEMDALRKSLFQEIDDDDLDAVAGGNDDIKGKTEPTIMVCPYCGQNVVIRQFQDGPKHMTKECPNNPYK